LSPIPRKTIDGELHRSERIGWLRAATLGANDGLISTSSLVVGVASAEPTQAAVLLAAVAGLVAGALSMAAGEYISVSSQADTERADLSQERDELAASPEAERAELARIYMGRGLNRELAIQVADQLTAHDALGAHARDELGINETTRARPIQAAMASAASFAVGAGGFPHASCGAVTGRGPAAGRRGSDVGASTCPRGCGCSPWRRLAHTRGAARCVLGCGGNGMYRRSRAFIRWRHLGAFADLSSSPAHRTHPSRT
jgi:VIT1/CCC1 family predicted Fe2+/Mn2+ transporter